MTLSVYTLLVFVHLLSATLLVGGAVTTRISMMVMRSASNAGEVIGAYKSFAIAPRVIGPSVAMTVLSGVAIVWQGGFPWSFWMVGSLVLVVLLNVWRVLVAVPPSKVLQAAVSQAIADPSAHGAALLAAARQPRIAMGHLGIEVIGVIIIALMVFKPA